jgi:polysaccharide chain length determinant protein (PEP-CTERM system associated)
MDELIGQVATILRGMWRHRWWGLLMAWVVTVIGSLVVISVPDEYEATARIYVDTQSILKPLMSGLAVQPNIDQQVVMLSRTLITRPNVEKLIRMADLDLKSQTKASYDALIEGLMKSLQIQNAGRDNIYGLAYRDSNPDQAKKVIQSLVSIFVESSLGNTRQDSDSAKRFIDEQIKGYVAKLEEAETRLKAFRVRNIELQNPEGQDMVGQLGALSSQLSQARLDLREAENARDSAKRQLEAEKAQSADMTTRSLLQESSLSISTPEIDARIDAQKRNLDTLLQRFTELHPDVSNTRRLIKELEFLKRKEVSELRKAAMATPMGGVSSNSLAYQELNRMLAVSEIQIASLRARVGEFQTRVDRARSMMKTAPQIEAEYAQLNRDYEVNKKNYNDLVSRRESASMSGELDSAAGVADFRLIEPPRVSPKPVAPNRLLLMPLALMAGLAAGLGLAFVMSQLRVVYYEARALEDAIRLPMLGSVSMVMDDGASERRRTELKKFFAASFGLLLIFVAAMIAMYLLSGRSG